MGSAVVIKGGHAHRFDPRTGADNARAAASDGKTIVIVYANSRAHVIAVTIATA